MARRKPTIPGRFSDWHRSLEDVAWSETDSKTKAWWRRLEKLENAIYRMRHAAPSQATRGQLAEILREHAGMLDG